MEEPLFNVTKKPALNHSVLPSSYQQLQDFEVHARHVDISWRLAWGCFEARTEHLRTSRLISEHASLWNRSHQSGSTKRRHPQLWRLIIISRTTFAFFWGFLGDSTHFWTTPDEYVTSLKGIEDRPYCQQLATARRKPHPSPFRISPENVRSHQACFQPILGLLESYHCIIESTPLYTMFVA